MNDETRSTEANLTDQGVQLTLIGYWAGPDTTGTWPSVEDFVDPAWDEDDRDFIVYYLSAGQVARTYMGWSRCRFCGKNNGDMELTDGTYVWPNGLSHYVSDHGVRLPDEFVRHADARTESLEEAERDVDWWGSAQPEPRTVPPPGGPDVADEASGSPGRTVLWPEAEPSDELPVLDGRDAVVDVIGELQRELVAGSEEAWENNTLERFLNGFGELLGVIERSYTNARRSVPTNPWVLVADALRGARHHE